MGDGMNNELTAALLTIEKCRELTNCPAGVDLQDWVKQLAAERDAALNAERVWETAMMEVCGEDGPASVAAVINALAAENVALKKFCKNAAFDADYEAELGMEKGGFTDALNDIETPATDRIVAGIKADGVEEFAAPQRAITEEWACKEGHSSLLKVAERAELFAKQLREGKSEEVKS